MNIRGFLKKFFFAVCLFIGMSGVSAWAQEDEYDPASDPTIPRRYEDPDGFVFYRAHINHFTQATDENGKIIIPASRGYRYCTYMPKSKKIRASVYENKNGVTITYYGVFNTDGTEIIPRERLYTKLLFVSSSKRFSVKKGEYSGVCDSLGREIISPDMHYIDCKPHQEKYYYVTDGGHSGVIDYNTGKVLIPLDRGYTYTRYNPAHNYIQVKCGDLIGACLEDGTELIPPVWFGCVFNSARGKFMVKSSPDKLWEEYKFQ